MLNSKLKAYHQYATWTLDNEEDVRSGEQPINPVILETSNLPVVFSMSVGGIHWRAEATILADKVLLSDPTGPAAEPSNRDSDLLGP
jgi:hypothetical protein